MTLGDVIKRYRTEHGLSMEKFEKMSGLSKAYVAILEKNVNPTTGKAVVPSIVTFKAASLAMGMDMDDLIRMVDEDTFVSLDPVDKVEIDLSAQEILDDMRQKREYASDRLELVVDKLSYLDKETIDDLIAIFEKQVNLCADVVDRFVLGKDN